MENLSRSPSVRVRLINNWHTPQKAKQSLWHPREFRPDHDIVIIPFTRLSHWSYSIPAGLSDTLSTEPNDKQHSLLHQIQVAARLEADGFSHANTGEIASIENLQQDTREWLEKCLDSIHGTTANHLRLERFVRWYEPGESWKSAYEEQLLADLRADLSIFMRHDGGLHSIGYRHRTLQHR